MEILFAAAVIPPIVLVFQIYRMDKIEKEPFGLLVKLFLFGGMSIIIAAIFETALQAFLSGILQTGIVYDFIKFFVIVAVVEEAAKYSILKKITWNNPEFNYAFDAVVYSVVVSLGFACFENILYTFQYGMHAAFIRAFTAIVLHGICGVFMGCGYGTAKLYEASGKSLKCRMELFTGILSAIIIHGFYDFAASQESEAFGIVFLLFVLIMYVVTYRKVKALSRGDHRIVQNYMGGNT